MCGICGIWDPAGFRAFDAKEVAHAMGSAIEHRGPDGEGIWQERDLLFVHRRLAVIDTSPAGDQPMISPCGRFAIVFNGEIYNHRTIRDELERDKQAPNWRGHSDTETILAAFQVYGVKRTLQKLVGMFSIALWDREDRSLILARDRAGEKPLYYTTRDNMLIFGSDLNSFRAVPTFTPKLDRRAPKTFLRYGYIPAPFTIYKDVHKLEAGHYATVRLSKEGFAFTHDTYWSLEECVRSTPSNQRSDTERLSTLEKVLQRSVEDQMLSDVPLGAFLSGGIDSSLIVALMQKVSKETVKTFTIGFSDKTYDESIYARDVAQHLKTDHTEMILEPSDITDVIPKIPNIYSEPFADSSQLPTYLVSKLARESVTVALSGDAGDEIFAGYNRYLNAYQAWKKLSRIPPPVRSVIARATLSQSPAFWDKAFNIFSPILPKKLHIRGAGDKAHKLAGVLSLNRAEDFYAKLTNVCQNPEAFLLEDTELPSFINRPQDWPDFQPFQQVMMAVDFKTYMADDILVKVDRAAMANSLETRAPFLDHRVISEAWSMPFDFKARDGVGKWPLRQILYKYVPQELIDRPKMGFGIPIGEWMRGPLREWAEAQINPERLRREQIFNPEAIAEIWAEHLSGERNWQHVLWNVFMFQSWQEATHPDGLN